MAKVTQADANYRTGTAARNCGKCSMFTGGGCTDVQGKIAASDVCDLFDPKAAKSIGRLLAPVEFKFVEGSGVEPGTFEGHGSIFNTLDWHGDIVLPGAFTESLADHKSRGEMPGLFVEHSFAMFGGDPLPVGVWLDMEEDETGLKGVGKISALDSDHSKRIIGLMRDGAMKGLSIAFQVPEGGADYGKKPGEPKRWLKKLNLYSVDIVREPSNSQAQIAAVKSTLAHADHAGALAAVTNAIKLHNQTLAGGDSPTVDERQQLHDCLRAAYRCLSGNEPKSVTRPETIRDFEALLRDAGYSNRLAREIAAHGLKAALAPRDDGAAVTAEVSGAIKQIAEALRGFSLAA